MRDYKWMPRCLIQGAKRDLGGSKIVQQRKPRRFGRLACRKHGLRFTKREAQGQRSQPRNTTAFHSRPSPYDTGHLDVLILCGPCGMFPCLSAFHAWHTPGRSNRPSPIRNVTQWLQRSSRALSQAKLVSHPFLCKSPCGTCLTLTVHSLQAVFPRSQHSTNAKKWPKVQQKSPDRAKATRSTDPAGHAWCTASLNRVRRRTPYTMSSKKLTPVTSSWNTLAGPTTSVTTKHNG